MANSTTFAFSAKTLSKLSTNGKTQWFRDARQGGFELSITPRGTITFYARSQHNGNRRREKLGRFPELAVADARRLAAERVNARNRPAAGRATFADAFEIWSRERATNRTFKKDKRKYETLPALHKRRLSSFTAREFQELHAHWAEQRGRTQANRVLSFVKSVVNLAVREGLVELNPIASVQKYPESSRERYLSPMEVKRFLAAVEVEKPVHRDVMLTLLFTGARLGNVLQMAWKDVDLQLCLWQTETYKTRGRERKTIMVVLAGPMVDLLERRLSQRHPNCPWVFPSPRWMWKPLGDIKHRWQSICKRGQLENVRIHDLRRTLGSWQALSGTSELIIAKSLGHAPGSGATAVYARMDLEPVRQSVEGAVQRMIAITEERHGHRANGDRGRSITAS